MKTLVKQLEGTIWTWETPTPNLWGFQSLGGEYEVLTNSANNITAYSNTEYIDMAGLSQQEKTMFIEGLAIEYQTQPSAVNATPGDQIQLVILVSDVPADTTAAFVGPGFAVSDMDMMNCAICATHVWTFTQDSAAWSSIPTLTSMVSNGLMQATSSDRLYVSVFQRIITRKSGPTTSTLDNVVVPGIRVVCNVEAREEPEFQYIMRLRRSYELAQS